ncbi:o-methyltransferase domain-containing protein [Hirsutella rhossiliensis]|uniref:O-methyltransferase domain-containing protein n=1 Tax=Hirsutella rhossiliensis TaxID=111463 RepID=A0A9P8MWA2_9HYPO|nr:o-methyltransferase domain-containing protein [Hirsutella rhossiliensis]KAH0962364.1 o-methyltransferase domain-containing protein [Hirsutella rhossiliensis]
MAAKLESLIQQLAETTESIRNNPASFHASTNQHARLADALQVLRAETRQPTDVVLDLLPHLAELTVLRLFIKWKVFENIPADGEISFRDLASKLGAETNLITRFASVLVASGVLKQVGYDRVAHSPMSPLFTSGSPVSAFAQITFDNDLRSLLAMPDYFERYGLKEPAGRYHTVYSFSAGDPELTVWEQMNKNKTKMADFMTTMAVLDEGIGTTYDFSWLRLEANSSKDRVLLVDVGGGRGQAVRAICQAVPDLPVNRCVVEDLAEVVEEARLSAEGEMKEAQFVALDFHKEQPVKGALLYYFRHCLHDYGDEDSVCMLQQIRDAMVADSRLLIVEQILISEARNGRLNVSGLSRPALG